MKVDAKAYKEFLVAEKLLKDAFKEYETTMNDIKARFKTASQLYHFSIPPETYGTESGQ